MIKTYKNIKHKKIVTATRWDGTKESLKAIEALVSPDEAILNSATGKIMIKGQDMVYFSPVKKSEMVVRPSVGVSIGLAFDTFEANYREVENV